MNSARLFAFDVIRSAGFLASIGSLARGFPSDTLIAENARQKDERAKATVRELLDEQLTFTRDESTAGLAVETVQPGRFTGQVIRDGKRVVYASLPASKKWLTDNRWQTAKPFVI